MFSVTDCERCEKKLSLIRTMSWFNEDIICPSCKDNEAPLRNDLKKLFGSDFEGCGLSIKEIKNKISFIKKC